MKIFGVEAQDMSRQRGQLVETDLWQLHISKGSADTSLSLYLKNTTATLTRCFTHDIRNGSIVDEGVIEFVHPEWVIFRSLLGSKLDYRYYLRGCDWVESEKDHFLLEAC